MWARQWETHRGINSFPLYRPKPPSAAPPLTGWHRLHRSPLLPAETARLMDRQNHAAWINPFHAHIKRWRYIRWRCLRLSQIISAHVSRLHSRISGWFVQFLSSLLLHSFTFWHVLTAAWQQWTLNSDSELDFDGFVVVLWSWGLVKRTFCGSFELRQRCGLKLY